eukprot:TRINITY_DN59622_c0_g1_i1.p1 TRINITY_DN59622_c0_g1~~TRINITY_DN59622_c0_g1_i1.p1  ORF type:complete len:351 (-),score=115.38 TRINITY_DN59622_c0_g1_i1:930-1922(-)
MGKGRGGKGGGKHNKSQQHSNNWQGFSGVPNLNLNFGYGSSGSSSSSGSFTPSQPFQNLHQMVQQTNVPAGSQAVGIPDFNNFDAWLDARGERKREQEKKAAEEKAARVADVYGVVADLFGISSPTRQESNTGNTASSDNNKPDKEKPDTARGPQPFALIRKAAKRLLRRKSSDTSEPPPRKKRIHKKPPPKQLDEYDEEIDLDEEEPATTHASGHSKKEEDKGVDQALWKEFLEYKKFADLRKHEVSQKKKSDSQIKAKKTIAEAMELDAQILTELSEETWMETLLEYKEVTNEKLRNFAKSIHCPLTGCTSKIRVINAIFEKLSNADQ